MSQTDIENLKAGFDAYNDGDFDRMLELWDEDVELLEAGRRRARAWKGGGTEVAGPRCD